MIEKYLENATPLDQKLAREHTSYRRSFLGLAIAAAGNKICDLAELHEIDKYGSEISYAIAEARKRGFSDNASLVCGRPVGGRPDPDSRRGFGPTGHIYTATEGGRTEEFEI